ncbi:rod shape-determining protein RodA [candidate division WOR-1 bacterium RIFCSPHIGHO2_01_FULL_53_15]|uniref:Peptidoglycan glycosyltransferase RodA n=1 Tax=candidate division WOR-1 bacterium RIFCSPHIGHO2_01_FULL_53_15 TaxID=1802564 RepID=A0A1F4Q1L5_UNCSA|nr:MAG: rod shape-determining protein RodA [candidate division WOR-1 bacterium RIFCSPHIGHO2_01_FULL_53_15]OGC10814.1 MAG: rod shape-determining protein RodA [candidate division WOR-1 bacterium RIFCSPHIGHO2_02_FULL_53_26]
MINFRMLKLSDPWLWFSAGALIVIGFTAIFSATYQLQIKADLDPLIFVKRQFMSLLLALTGLCLFTYFDYKHLKKAALFLYGFTIVLLVAILFTGSSAAGAQRWLQLGPVSFQPSELSKLTLIVALAAFFSERKKIQSFWQAGYLLALVGIPFLLIFKQPDLGTALVFFAILLGLLTAAEASPRLLIFLVTPIISILLRPVVHLWLVYLLAVALVLFLTRARARDWLLILGINVGVGIALPYLWGMLKAYQRQRILAFLNPAADPYGAGYHSLQSIIAVGGGGFFGKGFMHGTQTQLQFIPEQHSDFIFSVMAEEFGFLGAAAVLALFALLIWRALVIASESRDTIGKLLASGIAVMLGFHVFANMGMVIGILPVVGIPLPFMSFGGTSLFVGLASVGILQSISMRRHKIIF